MATIVDNGPELSEADVLDLERLLGAALPGEYRRFLSRFNGGIPTPDIVDVPEYPDSPTDVQVFFGVRRPVETSCLGWNLTTFAGRLGEDILPIATDSGGNLFCLSLRTEDRGAVLYCDLESTFGDMDADPKSYLVASSFGSFLRGLKTL